jgi:hypothetical protein
MIWASETLLVETERPPSHALFRLGDWHRNKHSSRHCSLRLIGMDGASLTDYYADNSRCAISNDDCEILRPNESCSDGPRRIRFDLFGAVDGHSMTEGCQKLSRNYFQVSPTMSLIYGAITTVVSIVLELHTLYAYRRLTKENRRKYRKDFLLLGMSNGAK